MRTCLRVILMKIGDIPAAEISKYGISSLRMFLPELEGPAHRYREVMPMMNTHAESAHAQPVCVSMAESVCSAYEPNPCVTGGKHVCLKASIPGQCAPPRTLRRTRKRDYMSCRMPRPRGRA